MRKFMALLAIVLLAGFATNAKALEAGDKALEIEFTQTWNGEQKKLSDFEGEYVFLNFWATW